MMSRPSLWLALSMLVSLATAEADDHKASGGERVYVVHTNYHATWNPFLKELAQKTTLKQGTDATLPDNLGDYRLVLISGDLKRYAAERHRLRRYVEAGGTLLLWFIDDERHDPEFFPFKLVNGGDDPGTLTFADRDHALLKGLRGMKVANGEQGGDVVRDWDKERWLVLADTPNGPAMLLGAYGKGHFLVCQFATGFAEKKELQARLATNVVAWLDLAK